MLLFTWNLGRSEQALQLALNHLAGVGPCLASLQEVPPAIRGRSLWPVPASLHDEELAQRGLRLLGIAGSGRVVLLAGSGLGGVGPARTDAARRMAMAVVAGDEIVGLRVVGYHGFDRTTYASEFGRGAHGIAVRTDLDAFWDGGPLVVLGDFNADPYAPEVSSHLGLFALRDRDEVPHEEWAHPHPGARSTIRPLFNPMWELLPEQRGRSHPKTIPKPRNLLRNSPVTPLV